MKDNILVRRAEASDADAIAQSAYAALGMQKTGYEIYETLLPGPSTQEH